MKSATDSVSQDSNIERSAFALPVKSTMAPSVRTFEKMKRLGASVTTILAMWLLWEFVYRTKLIDLTFFPPPSKFLTYIVKENFSLGLGRDRSNVGVSVASSFLRVFIGLSIAFVLAIFTGIIASIVPLISYGILPLIRLLAPLAPIAWIPLALALFGIGNVSAIALVFIGTYPVLVIAMVAAINQVDPELLKTAGTLGATQRQKLTYVILPASLPSVFTMLRINFIAAWMSVLAAEMVGLRDGLGALILIGRESSNPDLILAGMTLIGLSGFLIDQALLGLQKRFLWWEADRKDL